MEHDINQVAVIGAGLMGHGIAQAFAQKEFKVALYDLTDLILEKSLKKIESNLSIFAELGLIERQTVRETLSRIEVNTDLKNAVEKADFVIEAVPEDLELKRKVFKEIDRNTHDHTILASNTSMLQISEFGSEVLKKDKLIITHWFNPPYIVPVVEIVMGKETSESTYQNTYTLLRNIGKEPIKVLKEIPGFLINRIQTAMFREVLSLLEKGVASAEDIDKAIKGSFGMRLSVIGVLETMDMAGLDLMYKGTKHLFNFIESSTEPPKILKEKVEKGELGIKTGKGFFAYDDIGGSQKTQHRDKKLLKILKVLST